jgi:hypothetical protein
MTTAAPLRQRESKNRRLERACGHVEDLWFPINSQLLGQIKSEITNSGGEMQAEALIARISSDVSLFFFCLRESCRMLQEDGVELPAESSPQRILEHAGVERLKTILATEVQSVSRHSFERITPCQRQRFEEMLLSCSTSESLARYFEIDREFARSCALARQLGLTLIAWNYPDVFEKALAQIRPETPLDVILSQILGFSPLLLSLTLLRRWGLSSSFTDALIGVGESIDLGVSSPEEQAERAEAEAIEGTLVRLCRIGEALARANYPETYPTARSDWADALEVIEHHLGEDGLDTIRERFLENSSTYVTFCPSAFKGGLILDPIARQREHLVKSWRAGNPWMEQCREYLRQRLESFYLSLPEAEVASKHLELLVREVLPSAGYRRGCIFTIDPGTQCLMPRLCVGTARLEDYSRVQYDSEVDSLNAVARAFNERKMITTRPINKDDEFAHLSHVLGYSQRIGVLHLTLPVALLDQDSAQHEVHVKALSQALNDCLCLR